MARARTPPPPSDRRPATTAHHKRLGAGRERLGRAFFARPTLDVACSLIGTKLTRIDRRAGRLSGWITEAEAYVGPEDLASHARHGLTRRNAPMWGEAGHAYVYFTYGMHWMLNFVTEAEGEAGAVLIRGLLPEEGVSIMRTRRGGRPDRQLTDGPAKLCQALAIDKQFNALDVCQPDSPLFVSEGIKIPEVHVTRGPRVGLYSVPEPWVSRPWRFRVTADILRKLLEGEGTG